LPHENDTGNRPIQTRSETLTNSGNHPALELRKVLELLVTDQPLPPKNEDHALTGNWKGFRDCHIKPDLVLIYSLPDAETLRLTRLGSHSELGL
jgi:YafQ family addiction module toxin component